MVTKSEQIEFFSKELEELEFEVKETFEVPAVSLLKSGKLFIIQYKGYDERRGNAFFDIKNLPGYHTPRIDQLLNCFKLQEDKMLPNQWGNLTYSDLLEPLNSEVDMSETKLVDYMKSNREGWIRMILNQMNVEFIESLKYNDILGLGPTIPPFEYLLNLKNFSEKLVSNGTNPWDKILNFSYSYELDRQPELIDERIDIAEFIIDEVNKNKVFIFQGPPGTGKTYQVADVVSRLARNNFSVLITSLTNKAAVEVCEKPFLSDLMANNKVFKTSLSSSELSTFPKLKYAKEIKPVKGEVLLSTYYQFSKYWEVSYDINSEDNLFDYVVVEEASQAFLTTIAAAFKVGHKVIIVGDPLQIQPIVKNKNYRNIADKIDLLVNGLKTICDFKEIPFYRKVETRRLTSRATDYTNVFYRNTIVSKALNQHLNSDVEKLGFLGKFIHPKGGPTLILKEYSDRTVKNAIPFLIRAIDDITISRSGSVAVLTPFIDTLILLQKELKSNTSSTNYLIETVDRVQGLDVDYCFYIMPDKNYRFSFYLNRFNVATSRSKKATFIIADKEFYLKSALIEEPGNYLRKLLNDFCFVEINGSFIKKI